MKLWSSQTVTQLEATLVDFTVVVVIDEAVKTNNLFTASAVALVFALQFIPALPASLIAGTIADIIDRRLLMLFLNIFRSVFLVIFIFASNAGTHLFVFVFIMAICMHSYDVIEKSTLRNVTSEKELSLANGLFLGTLNATTLIGVIGATVLYATIGFQAILLSGAILYAAAAYIVYKLPKNINNFHYDHYEEAKSPVASTAKAMSKLVKNLSESFHYLISIPPVWLALILATMVQTVILLIASISFRFGDEVLRISHIEVALFLLFPISLGLAIGAVLTPVLTNFSSYRKVVSFSWFISALNLIIIGSIAFITTNLRPGTSFEFIFFLIFVAFMGIFVTLIQAPSLELIQRFADPRIRGRVFGILVGATNTISGILVAGSGFLIDGLRTGANDNLGTSKFLIVLGGFLLVAFFVYRLLLKRVLGNKDYIDYGKEDNSELLTQ